jgi:hypothetical protein
LTLAAPNDCQRAGVCRRLYSAEQRGSTVFAGRLASADNTTASWALFAIAEQNWRCGKINRLLRQRMAGLHPQSAFYEEILAYLNDDKAA